MVKLRKWKAYRKIERPYTRWSKQRGKAFAKSRPGKTIVKYDMGNLQKGPTSFDLTFCLLSKDDAQIRTNALEACRTTVLKKIEAKFGRGGFYLKIKAVPHHIIRENKLAAGAGADRLSTGMKHSFGKIVGTAAQVFVGSSLFEFSLPKTEEVFARKMLKLISQKLPVRTTVKTIDNREVIKTKKFE
jgi:large subunit ribosomal protein L10e